MSASRTPLQHHLAHALPHGVELDLFHISTPPTLCPALFAPPPGQKPIETYCEEHLLNVTHTLTHAGGSPSRRVAIFAIEVYIYTTESLTTVFVSKADSTGYAHLLPIPHGYRSILKTIALAFVDFLVTSRHRTDRKLNLCLFARAQDQYLFPGSVEHGKKHVLSDRGLVKWWCSTLDPIARKYAHPDDHSARNSSLLSLSSRAYLIVPGHDKYETASFFPPSARQDPEGSKRWTFGHPLREITSYPAAAPRSMVPHFPDDPKSRFLLDLDEELANAAPSGELETQPSPSKRGTGQWTSVKTLEQFWEMMAYRQECSSGRLVGFLWIMFTPEDDESGIAKAPPSPSIRPAKRKRSEAEDQLPVSKKPQKSRKKRKSLKGPIVPRQPRLKTAGSALKASKLPVEKAKAWYWPLQSRGSIIISEKAYERVIKILHRLDFANLDVACTSTEKWIREAAVVSGARSDWGVHVVGNAAKPASSLKGDHGASLPTPQASAPTSQASVAGASSVNTLNTGLVRKKAKATTQPTAESTSDAAAARVNNLGGGLVRKKPKA